MEKKEEKKSLLKQSMEQGDNGSFALDMMCRHQQYHGTLKETQYVLRGSLAACQYGTGLSRLDMARDYGVYKGGRPVMTCADCRTENIHGFGSCMCPEKKYAGCLPMNGEMHPGGGKAAKLPGNESAQICVPHIKSGWKQAGGNTLIYTEEEGYVPALTDQAVLACQYGGIISIQSVPKIPKKGRREKEKKLLPLETAWLEKRQKKYKEYVTAKDLKKLGWEKIRDYYMDKKTKKKSDWLDVFQKDGTFKPDPEIEAHYREIKGQDLINLNRVLTYYKITSYIRICSFMAQITHECGKGERMCEGTGTKEHPLKGPATRTNMRNWYKKYVEYPFQYRGGGTIQLTYKENYEYAAKKIGDARIKSGTEYLAFCYPWLCAGIYWEWRKINSVENDYDAITEKINGGHIGDEDRKKEYKKCLEVFKRYKNK